MDEAAWQRRVDRAWEDFDRYGAVEFVALVEGLAAELPPEHPVALFERAGAYDATGAEATAVDLYRRALAGGLSGQRRRRAVIQLASSLRNVGEAGESVALLEAERERESDGLDDAIAGFLALSLVDAGREREAVAVALGALAGHLSMYRRSLADYARLLAEPGAGQ